MKEMIILTQVMMVKCHLLVDGMEARGTALASGDDIGGGLRVLQTNSKTQGIYGKTFIQTFIFVNHIVDENSSILYLVILFEFAVVGVVRLVWAVRLFG